MFCTNFAENQLSLMNKMMEKDFDFKQVPVSWALCYIKECPRKDECMRYQVQLLATDETFCRSCILPTVMRGGKPCSHFHPIKKVRVAAGFKKILAEVKEKHRAAIRLKLASYLGKGGTYYRYRNGTSMLMPEQQAWIINMLREYGYTEGIEFDSYKELYRYFW